MTYLVGTLLILGAAFEVGGIGTIVVDVRDAARETRKRGYEAYHSAPGQMTFPDMLALTYHWLERANGNLRRRMLGVVALIIGVVVQTIANVLALSL